MKRVINKNKIKNTVCGYIFLSPLIIGLLVFTIYPIIKSVVYSFHDFNLFEDTNTLVWFGNYKKIFTGDSEIGKTFANTAIYSVITVPLNLLLSYFLAVIVNNENRITKLYRVLFYLPVVIPGVVSGVLWKAMLGYPEGVMNNIFSMLGLGKNTFFTEAGTSMFAIIYMGLWGIGGGMILWLSAFKNIPKSMYEASSIDGAGTLSKVFNITIPMSTSMIFYNLVMGIIGALQCNSTLVFAPRGGRGYDNSVYFVGIKIYREAFVRWQVGYASSIAWVLFIIIACLTSLTFATNKWVYYGD